MMTKDKIMTIDDKIDDEVDDEADDDVDDDDGMTTTRAINN